jgi:hypothetical protein
MMNHEKLVELLEHVAAIQNLADELNINVEHSTKEFCREVMRATQEADSADVKMILAAYSRQNSNAIQ